MRRVLLAAILSLAPVAAGAEVYAVPNGFWLDTRSGAGVLAEPAVAQAVRHFLQRPQSKLVLHHARDDESTARAEELRGWLIALGLEAGRVELAESAATDRTIQIEVTGE